MNDEPIDPRDPSSSDPGSRDISAAAETSRAKLREEFEQLRVEIEELDAEEISGDGPAFGAGFRDRARASLAVLALTAAVAAAASNFALNGGRTPNTGSVSVPPASREPEPGAITADLGSADTPFPLLSLIPPGLQTDTLGSNAGLPGAVPPVSGPSPLFVVGEPVPVSVNGSPGEDVAGADPVDRSPTPTSTPPVPASTTPSVPAPDAPQQFAYAPPPPPASGGGPGGGGSPGDDPGDPGVPGDGSGGGGKGPDDGREPSKGEGSAGNSGGGGGNGVGNGHIKARGKGHGGSSGKGHEKDQGGGEVAESGYGDNGNPGDDPGSHGKGKKSRNDAPPPATETPSDPVPPVAGPSPGSNENPGKSESHGNGQGKSTAPGQSAK